MVPGCIGGRYRPDELTIDLARLARASGAGYLESSVAGFDPSERFLTLSDGSRRSYDLLSFAIGAGLARSDSPGVREVAVPVKPIDRALEILPSLERAMEQGGGDGPAVVVAGAGAGGIELALNLRARLRLLGRPAAPVTVVDGSEWILPERPAARRAAAAALASNDVAALLGRRIDEVRQREVVLAGGGTIAADLVVWVTGAAAPALFRSAGVATDREGFLLVDGALRSISHPELFGAGDAVGLQDYPGLSRSGVFAVRQGPVLRDNLAAAARGRRLRRFRPRRRYLALLNTGDGSAILSYGGVALASGWVMLLKDRIDRRFMRRFQR